MVENKELLEKLKSLLSYKKSKTFYAEKLGITTEEVDELLKEIRGKESTNFVQMEGWNDIPVEYTTSSTNTDYQSIVNIEKGTLQSSVTCDFEPKSPEELASLHKVDLTKYKISSYWTKQKGEKFTSSLLCTLIKPSEFSPEQFAEFLKEYKSPKITFPISEGNSRNSVYVEISLMDFHLDKKTLDGETLQQKKSSYLKVLKELVDSVSLYPVAAYIFTISSDFFQTDSYNNTTTKGTPVDTDVSFDTAYEEGFDLLVKAISMLRYRGESVHVIHVPGNHDRTKSFYLAHALELYFKNDGYIRFDRSAENRKYAIAGNTFLGYHHGDCKIDDLPLIFATDNKTSGLFGQCKYREIHTGDKHYYLTKEIKGVRVQQVPSLSGTDRWHEDNNFINNIRAGLAFVYHPTKGKIAEFESRI